EIRRKLYPSSKYPDGHADLAQSLNNLGFVLKAIGQADKALTFYQQGLDMTRQLYPASKYPDGFVLVGKLVPRTSDKSDQSKPLPSPLGWRLTNLAAIDGTELDR